MLSLYIHIPFCKTKCSYCSFQVCPQNQLKKGVWEVMITKYITALKKEIIHYAKIFPGEKIYTLYFGGGTPSIIGQKNILEIMQCVEDNFDLEDIAELSIELNPYPQTEIYDFIKNMSQKYRRFPRIRYSFGIQSLDNQILTRVGRENSFRGLVDFLRGLKKLKKDNMVYNFDFIAFGGFNETKKGNMQLWNNSVFTFFQDFVASHLADSFSVYTLELFEGSFDYYTKQAKKSEQELKGNNQIKDDNIYQEFSILKDVILDAGYHRYEISNFCLPGKSSIHNRVYREMGNYIGLGTSASGCIQAGKIDLEKVFGITKGISSSKVIRYQNTINLSKYKEEKFIDQNIILNQKDYLIEKFFLAMRTDKGISNIRNYKAVLVNNYEEIISTFQKNKLVEYQDDLLKLTDKGMDVYSSIIIELLQNI